METTRTTPDSPKQKTEIKFWLMEKQNGDYVVMTAEKAERSWATKIKGFATEWEAQDYLNPE
jgi:hypothetical protein